MFIAEREGFEPPEPLSSTVFKTAAIDHSAISPVVLQIFEAYFSDFFSLLHNSCMEINLTRIIFVTFAER